MEKVVVAAALNSVHSTDTELLILKKLLDRYEEEEIFVTSVVLNMVLNDEHIRPDGFFEDWLPRYLEQDFYNLYRMTRKTFANLLAVLHCQEKTFIGGKNLPVPIEKQLLMTLWWLGKGEVLLSVADKFNVALSTVFMCTEYMIEQILLLKTRYITWPDRNEIHGIENDFQERSGFPGVIGAIDGTCVKFKPPKEQQNSYIDKESNHSIKLQGIVTCNKIFTDIVVGFPGSAHDSRVFTNSHLYVDIEENGNANSYFYGEDFHLLGDKAYPLRTWIMTPYKDNGNLEHIHKNFNHRHSVTRIVVEHTFGILKGRWAILKYINVNSVQKAVKVIAACCILHNFCYVHFDFWNEYEQVVHEDNEGNNNERDDGDASEKRNVLAQRLM